MARLRLRLMARLVPFFVALFFLASKLPTVFYGRGVVFYGGRSSFLERWQIRHAFAAHTYVRGMPFTVVYRSAHDRALDLSLACSASCLKLTPRKNRSRIHYWYSYSYYS